ncbi:MAG: extracellular solute-binding protein, partial [Chloroflexota bacterium]|nr:extracellular solute-binding protein [Chloroflexota bacterium]
MESSVYWPRTGLARLRSSRFVAILAVLALTLAACSGGDDGSSSAPGDSAAPGGSQAPGDSGGATGGFEAPTENVELTLWNPFTGPDGDFFSQIVEDFNAATPTCQVTVETKVGAEYAAQLEAAASANELPHVIAAGYDALPGHVENGIVVPIDEFAEQGGYGPDLFPEAIWNAGEWKGQRVGIPIDTHTMNLYYNKALFEEAGLDPESAPSDQASFE